MRIDEQALRELLKQTLLVVLVNLLWEKFAFSSPGSEVLYLDEDVNFLLLDQVPGDLKEGDRLCLYHSSMLHPFCQASFRWISRKPLVFVTAEIMSQLQVGTRIEVKKIYVSDRRPEGSGYTDATSFGRDYLAKNQGNARAEQLLIEQQDQPKIPKGETPRLQTEVPAIAGNDFPEIFIPKIRKQKPRSKKDTGETAETIAAIKKSLKEKSSQNFQFLPVRADLAAQESPDKEAEIKPETEIPPSPLHQAIDFAVFQTQPVLPVAAFQSLRFRTVSSDSLSRKSLWVKNKNELKPVLGAGFSLNLMQNLSRIVSFGWRYHVYEKAQSRATFDEIESNREVLSTTRINAQAVHAAIGWRYALLDNLTFDTGPGLDLFYSEVWFRSVNVDTANTRESSLGFARSSFFFIAPRWHSALNLQYRGWGMQLGGILNVPLVNFNKDFDGSATPPDRLIYSEDPGSDLNRSLTHKMRTVGFEAYLGLSYQPQRN